MAFPLTGLGFSTCPSRCRRIRGPVSGTATSAYGTATSVYGTATSGYGTATSTHLSAFPSGPTDVLQASPAWCSLMGLVPFLHEHVPSSG